MALSGRPERKPSPSGVANAACPGVCSFSNREQRRKKTIGVFLDEFLHEIAIARNAIAEKMW